MQRTLIAVGCALAVTAGSSFAQQQPQPTPGSTGSASNNPSGGSITDRARQAAQTIGDKTREAAEKAKDKAQETAQKAKADSDQKSAQSGQSSPSGQDTQAMGASGSQKGGANDPQQMQKQADADYKSAKAQCEPMQQKSQKNLCEKQATAAHANAEVEIEKARAATEGSKSSAMGAGKSTQ
jgi:hypothetical protein